MARQIGGEMKPRSTFLLLIIVFAFPIYKYLHQYFPERRNYAEFVSYCDIMFGPILCLALLKFFPLRSLDLNQGQNPIIGITLSLCGVVAWSSIATLVSLGFEFVTKIFHLENIVIDTSFGNQDPTLQIVLMAVLIAPLYEEYYFRHVIIQAAKKVVNNRCAAIISSLVFAISHLDVSHALFDASTFFRYLLMAIVFLAVRIRFGLLYSILAHILNNIAALYLPNAVSAGYLGVAVMTTLPLTIWFVIIPAFKES